MKTINLEEIIEKYLMLVHNADQSYTRLPLMTKADVLKVIREVCEQAIDLCAENAEAGYKYCGKDPDVEPYVLKNSILDIKKQII